MKKRIISLLLVAAMALSLLPPTVLHVNAASTSQPIISVEEVWAASGGTIEVNVEILENPGILGATLTLSWADELTLVYAEEGDAFTGLTYQEPSYFASSGTNFVWYGTKLKTVQDGTVLKLTFEVTEDAVEGSTLAINITGSGITDADKNTVTALFANGGVRVLNYTPGDVDDSGEIDPYDLITLAKYISDGCKTDPNGYNVSPNVSASDVNDDGEYTPLDLILISQYISDGCITDPDGYNITLKPSTPKCNHTMESIAYKAATCLEDGNISYYHCTTCGKYYNDSKGTAEITLANTVLASTGHTAVTDPYVAPDYGVPGWTEGSHCTACGEVLVAQKEIAPLQKNEYYIYYHISGSDTYLIELEADGKIVNENPTTYTDGDSITLLNLSVPGFVFEGWYDGEGSNAEQIKKIENRAGTVHLYAHWTEVEYNVLFESELVPVDKTTYTVNQDTVLPTPKLDGYIFVGWSDGDGNIIKRISSGTIGNKTYTANWLSERNQAWAKTKLDDPLIYEDDDVILFVYEIGEIRNVPLYIIKDFGKINSSGVSQTVTTTYSTSVSEEQMENYTKTVARATIESFGWTLSSDWSKSTSVSEEWAEEHGMSVAEAQSTCTDESSNWYVSNGSSGTDTTVTLDTKDTYALTTTTENTKTYDTQDKENRQDFSAELGVDYSRSTTVEASVKGNVGVAEVEGSAGKTSEFGVGVDLKYSTGATTTKKTGTEGDEGSSDQTGTVSQTGTTTTNSSSWNSESGYGGSSTVSNSTSISNSISEMISNKYGYGEEYIESENQSNTQGHEASASNEDEYSSTVTYSKVTEKSVTATYETTNTMSGYHRWVMAGTAHVFGVVGYDIASESYFVTTYSVMDDEMHLFEDYSYDYASYDDNQNSVITFNIPADAGDYVADRVGASDGLEVSKDGVVTGYTGSDKFVIIPEYKVIKNLDGTATAIKITAISANAFSGKDIEGIELSDFITEIPDGAFQNCTALKSFEGKAITKIGRNAFAGCTSLKACTLSDSITSLGESAFEGLDSFAVHAANASVVEAALQSGAKEITIGVSDKCGYLNNMTLTVADTTDRFTFQGYGREYKDLYIESGASKTGIYRATFISSAKTPLHLSSELVILQEVTAEAPGIALVCTADKTNIYLYGESYMISSNEHAMLSKTVTLQKLKDDYYSQLHLIGNQLYCGEKTESSYLSVDSGEKIEIDEETFEKYAKGLINITFDANGGEVSQSGMTAYYGTAVGELPVPTRIGYTFVGWFTENEEQITVDSVLTTTGNVTLSAKWSALAYKASWNTGTGYTIAVKRTSSPYAGAATGALGSGATVYYGDVLSITYTANTGYTIATKGITSATVTGNITASNIYATASVNSYKASWNTGTGYSIAVSRTSSPKKGAATGSLSNGATVYYGDVLSITYTASTGYSIATKGSTSITVTGNVTSSNIYATATVNSYTYNIVYKSSNGTALGTATATYNYGTTNTISPKAFSGYTAPASQTVAWDSTSAKTITFTYTPIATATSQQLASGWWWQSNGSGITYTAKAEYRNRTANSVEIRIVWTQNIKTAAFGYNQYFYVSLWTNGVNRANTGNVKIASTSTWPYYSSSGPWHTGSVTAYSGWVTVPLDTTNATTVAAACDWWTESQSSKGSWSNKTISIPAY